MTIAEWIDRRGRPVPAAFRPYLKAEGPVSLDALIGAAEAELHACAGGASGDRAAAFSLLAADAYFSYACIWALTEGDACDLRIIAERIVRAWTPGEPV
ncbi:MAG: hypothetical protein OXQ94_00645 [Gemmatimonadota bacterium]|nr:hypothetical protein [Gemmatimonadota bacterium]MDE2870188.1 hypothetical protein [Gemmatimonadota bacterium]